MNEGERKRRGVLAVIGCSAAIFWPGALIFGYPGVMAPYWQKVFQVGRGAVGNTLFFVLAAVGVFMFLVGRWQERYGLKRMITIGVILSGLGLLIISYASKLYMLYLWAFITGTSSCFIYIPALTSVQRWYPERRGLVSGIVNLTYGFSAAIMSPIFGYLLTNVGYASMNTVVAIVALVIGIIAAQFTEGPASVQSFEGANPDHQVKPPAEVSVSFTVAESLRTKSFWFLWLTWAFQGAAGIAMVTLSTAFGLSMEFTMESAVLILTSFSIGSGSGRIAMGYLSDLVGRRQAMSIPFLAAGCAYFALPHVNNLIGLCALAAVVGFAFGTLFAVSAPLATDCFGLKHFGAIFGLVFTAYGFVSGLLGPSLSGYLLDVSGGNFMLVFAYLGIFCFLSSIFIRFVVRPTPRIS
jgi:MFS transporter, OFA family, oxalate/formate antiporter